MILISGDVEGLKGLSPLVKMKRHFGRIQPPSGKNVNLDELPTWQCGLSLFTALYKVSMNNVNVMYVPTEQFSMIFVYNHCCFGLASQMHKWAR